MAIPAALAIGDVMGDSAAELVVANTDNVASPNWTNFSVSVLHFDRETGTGSWTLSPQTVPMTYRYL